MEVAEVEMFRRLSLLVTRMKTLMKSHQRDGGAGCFSEVKIWTYVGGSGVGSLEEGTLGGVQMEAGDWLWPTPTGRENGKKKIFSLLSLVQRSWQ